MNHKITTTAIMTALVALVLTTAAFTVPTLHALALGFFGNGITLDQQINQLNKCKTLSSEGKYDPTSYDVGTGNQPTTESSHGNTDNNHTSTAGNSASAGNQTSTNSNGHNTNSGWYSNNNKNSNDAGNDNNKPSDNNGGYNDNDNNNNNNKKPSSSSVLCSNKATNLATIG